MTRAVRKAVLDLVARAILDVEEWDALREAVSTALGREPTDDEEFAVNDLLRRESTKVALRAARIDP